MDKHERWRRLALGFQMAACGLLVASCSLLPEAQLDPTRFYILSTSAVQAAPEPGAKAPSLHLRPVELASYIKAKPMIVRRGDNEIEVREYARWGEPLELGIGRVLREELLARGAAGEVLAAGLRAVNVDYKYELTVRVLACEGGTNGAIFFRAVWEVSSLGDKPEVVTGGDFRGTDLKWDGKSEGTLAAQLSRAVAGLAAEIAEGLAKVKR